MMTNSETAQLGNTAERLKDNPAYQSAMKAMHEQINLQWKNTPIRDKEGQTLILQLARCADIFESALTGLVESGKFAKHAIDLNQARENQGVFGRLKRAA